MKSKRGSHVGVILSFVIFVTFLILFYSLLQPSLKVDQNKEILLQNLKIELTQKFSSDVESVIFTIDEETSETCVKLSDLVKQLKNPNFILKDESGNVIVDVGNNDGDLIINRASVDDNFFKIYTSEEFDVVEESELSGCESIGDNSYIFESAKITEEIMLFLINKTKEEYETNYSLLKQELNIPVASNFGFTFTDGEGILIETQEQDISTSVYSGEMSILYVDNEANINTGFLTIRVW